jgi:SAM-dependent methyltransferase
MAKPIVTIEDVYQYWSEHPLFSGEGRHPIGSKEWFEEADQTILDDCFTGRGPESIYTRGLASDSAILDVGCGHGFWVRYFRRRGFVNVSACDLTPTAVQLTQQSLGLYGLDTSVNVQVGNAEHLFFEDATFDHVNCQGVIHHTPHPEKCIEEFHRVLRPGGTACISVYYKNYLLRHPAVLRATAAILNQAVKLPGLGRHQLLASGDPEEIVRKYDGQDNPLGKAYSLKDFLQMVGRRFHVVETRRHYFPARALPIRIPRPVHRWLHDRHGLMIVARGEKRA